MAETYFSYIIPTIGRKSLDVAVNSVLTQDSPHADFEVIVVNDSGSPLRWADWRADPRVRIVDTNKCERSFARNTGAAMAGGIYLAFLDDDDWILPGALRNFWELACRHPAAVWLYGGIRVVDELGIVLAEINSGFTGNCFTQIMGGAWAPIQASMIQARAFFEIGGFNPFIRGTEDEDLCRRAALHGEFANTPQVLACLFRGKTWSTSTNYRRAPVDTKLSRDLILAKHHVLRRFRTSADSSYWRGRILRVYLSTVAWNLNRRNYSTALSRAVHGLIYLGFSIMHIFTRDYWAGFTAHHAGNTLHFVMENYQDRMKDEESPTVIAT
jgi:glycosyltransferase involved in cell wall biosynthesis